MNTNKPKLSFIILFLVALMLVGNVGFSYIIGLLVGSAEFEFISLITSLILFVGSLFLCLRIIYQMDRNGSRLKRRINIFEPRKSEK